MLGPMGAHIISALRVMTPAEIDRYTAKDTKKIQTQALAAGGEEFDYSHSTPFGQSEQKRSREEQERKENPNRLGEAEIIPIDVAKAKQRDGEEELPARPKRNPKNSEEPEDAFMPSPGEDSELEKAGIVSSAKMNARQKALEDYRQAKEDSSTVFLLKERERLKKTNIKMAGNTALKTYFQTANADMSKAEPDLDDPDKEVAQGSKGILINKKHF